VTSADHERRETRTRGDRPGTHPGGAEARAGPPPPPFGSRLPSGGSVGILSIRRSRGSTGRCNSRRVLQPQRLGGDAAGAPGSGRRRLPLRALRELVRRPRLVATTSPERACGPRHRNDLRRVRATVRLGGGARCPPARSLTGPPGAAGGQDQRPGPPLLEPSPGEPGERPLERRGGPCLGREPQGGILMRGRPAVRRLAGEA